MVKTTLKIDGMMCGMCESHVNDTVRKVGAVKKVTSSHTKGKTAIHRSSLCLSRHCGMPLPPPAIRFWACRVSPMRKKAFSAASGECALKLRCSRAEPLRWPARIF